MLLEAQKKLQSSNQSPGDIHTPMSVASIAVETGECLLSSQISRKRLIAHIITIFSPSLFFQVLVCSGGVLHSPPHIRKSRCTLPPLLGPRLHPSLHLHLPPLAPQTLRHHSSGLRVVLTVTEVIQLPAPHLVCRGETRCHLKKQIIFSSNFSVLQKY